jgi:hypothetical protein
VARPHGSYEPWCRSTSHATLTLGPIRAHHLRVAASADSNGAAFRRGGCAGRRGAHRRAAGGRGRLRRGNRARRSLRRRCPPVPTTIPSRVAPIHLMTGLTHPPLHSVKIGLGSRFGPGSTQDHKWGDRETPAGVVVRRCDASKEGAQGLGKKRTPLLQGPASSS